MRMLLTKLSNFVSKSIITILYFCLFAISANSEESIDIWKKQDKISEKNNLIENTKESPKINILEKSNSNQKATIIEEKKTEAEPVQLLGLHDPGKNDLTLNMWTNTDGELIKNTFIILSLHTIILKNYIKKIKKKKKLSR